MILQILAFSIAALGAEGDFDPETSGFLEGIIGQYQDFDAFGTRRSLPVARCEDFSLSIEGIGSFERENLSIRFKNADDVILFNSYAPSRIDSMKSGREILKFRSLRGITHQYSYKLDLSKSVDGELEYFRYKEKRKTRPAWNTDLYRDAWFFGPIVNEAEAKIIKCRRTGESRFLVE